MKWCHQASTSFSRYCLLETLYLHETVRYLSRHPNLKTSSKKISSKKLGKLTAVLVLVAFYEGR